MSEMDDLLFGEGVIEKFNPDPADISPWRKGKYKLSPKQRREQSYKNFGGKKKNDSRQRAVTAGLSAVGAAAGVGGLAYGAHDMTRAVRAGKKVPLKTKALVPLEVAGLGGELMATKILHGDVKKKKIAKRVRLTELSNITIGSVGAGAGVGALIQNEKQSKQIKSAKRAGQRARLVAVEAGKASATGIPKSPGNLRNKAIKGAYKGARKPIEKVEFSGELSKLDSDRKQVFGWASVTKVNGEDVYDRQGDYIALEEVEKAAYHYVTNSRQGGDMHQRSGEVPLKLSDMIESFVVTPEKLEKMGIDPEQVPHGWWVGYQVQDEDLWQKVKAGERVGFSIHGMGVRTPMEA